MTQLQTTAGARKDPTTKANLLDRMMSFDFSGDLRDLAVGRDLRMERIRANAVRLKFGNSGSSFDLTIHKPRMSTAAEATSASETVKKSLSSRGKRQKKTKGASPPQRNGRHTENRTQH